MKRNTLFMYIAVTLAVLIPSPARFGYGLIVILCINVLMLIATASGKLLDFLNLDSLRAVVILILMVYASVLFRQIVILYSALCALNLGFVLYLPISAVLMLGNCFENSNINMLNLLKSNMKESLFFSLYAMFFFLVREIAGYGTISFPVPHGLVKLSLPQIIEHSPGTFWATIPGSIVLAGLLLAGVTLIRKKCSIISRSKELKEIFYAD